MRLTPLEYPDRESCFDFRRVIFLASASAFPCLSVCYCIYVYCCKCISEILYYVVNACNSVDDHCVYVYYFVILDYCEFVDSSWSLALGSASLFSPAFGLDLRVFTSSTERRA